jgi:hypothetical protein
MGHAMTELDGLERNIRELKNWLNAAWRQLASSAPTKFERGELRNEMKRCSTELQRCLQLVEAERSRSRSPHPAGNRSGPGKVSDFRFIGQSTSPFVKT